MKLTFLLVLIFSMNSRAQVNKLYGQAYDQTGKNLLYHEIHQVTLDVNGYNQLVETKYLDLNLKEFANMKSEFKSNLFVPDSELNDNRLKRKETLILQGDQARIAIFIEGNKKEEKVVGTDSSFVAGQGFNNFILKYFDDLASGQNKKVSFVVIPLLDFFKFQAARKKAPEENSATVEFKIQIASVFLKAFADPIYVQYDRKNRGLLEFRGLSNLSTAKDEKQQVVIRYSQNPPTAL